jgi:hypothetical protein
MHIDDWLKRISLMRALYAVYGLAVLGFCAWDYLNPLGPARFTFVGGFLLIPLTHLLVIAVRKLFDAPWISLVLPFLYWAVFYSAIMLFNQVGLAPRPTGLEALGTAILGYFYLGLFVSPGIILVMLESMVGLVVARFMGSRESRNIILGSMLLIHALTIYLVYEYKFILRT